MKAVPFFSDEITLTPHTATHEVHVGARIKLCEFGTAHSLSLYETSNGELHCKRSDGAFIEGPEFVKPASIQVQTTIDDGEDVRVCASSDMDATHWSVYLRAPNGEASHVKDFSLSPDTKLTGNKGMARQSALVLAATLSMEHNVPIEKIQ